jgi:hypothetical protein
MASPQMIVRIAANLDELKRNLAEGGSAINATATGLERMSSSLRGDALIRKAQEVTAAVSEIGGASMLTADKQEYVNRTVERALEHYRVLGREAPPAMLRLAEETRKAEQPTSLLHSTVGKLTAGFSAALIVDRVVSAVGDFARQAFEGAGKVLDLSAKTGLSTRSIQEMEAAAKLTGTSLETFTNAAFKLGVNLAGGGQSVEAAVRALGLSYAELRAQSPDEQFRTIADRLFTVEDAQTRNKLAVELFGRAAADILPAIAQNYGEIADSATIAGDQQLQALDMASDALDGATLAAKNLTTQFLGGLVIAGREVWKVFRDTTETALKPFAWVLEHNITMLEAFGLKTADVPKVQGPASLAIKQTTEAATALTLSWDEMDRISGTLTTSVQAQAEAHRVNAARVRESHTAAEPFTGLVSRSIGETAKLSRELERWAFQNGAVYASAKQVNAALAEQEPLVARNIAVWEQFKPAVTSSLGEGEAATGSFWDKVKGAFTGEGGVANAMAFVQGAATRMSGGLGTALQIGSAAARAFAGDWSGVVQLAGQYMDKLVGWVADGVKKIAGWFKSVFGGPSAEELAGRELVAAFERNLDSMLTDAQRIEAGNDAWKKTVIAIRDAYLAAGLTEEQALEDAKRLWESSKQGAEASRQVIAQIEANMRGAGQAARDAVNGINRELENLPDRITIPIEFEGGEGPGLPGYANGSGGIRDFGAGTLVMLHGRERVQTEGQMRAEQQGAGGGGGADLAALLDRLESVLPMALRDAVLMAGAR